MDPFGVEFGKTIGQLVGEYRTTFAWVAAIWHVATFSLLYLIFRSGNRYRRVLAILNWGFYVPGSTGLLLLTLSIAPLAIWNVLIALRLFRLGRSVQQGALP